MFDEMSGGPPHRGEVDCSIPLSGAALADSVHDSESYDGQFDEFWWQVDSYAEDWYDDEPPRRPPAVRRRAAHRRPTALPSVGRGSVRR